MKPPAAVFGIAVWLVVSSNAAVAAAPATQKAAPASNRASAQSPVTTHPGATSGVEDIELLHLDVPTVITATRHEQKITTVPYAMTVITADDIRRAGSRNVTDALRLAPGVDVADLGYNHAGVSPRGFHGTFARGVLILVDGRQIYDSVWGGTLWDIWPFQLEDIDRIEVIRGPGGVTWGSNAVEGVINIITKDPKDQVGLTTTAMGGFPEQHKEHVGYGFADDKLRMRVSGEYDAGVGFNHGGNVLRELNERYQAGRGSIFAIYDAGPKDKLTFAGGSNVIDNGYSVPVTAGFLPEHINRPAGQGSYLMGRWAHSIASDNSVDVTAYVNDFGFRHTMAAVDYRFQQIAFQIGHTFKPVDSHTLSWGIDSRTDIVDGSNGYCMNRNFISDAIVGAYVQDEWRFAPKWALNLGARLDYDFYGGFQPSARSALSYELAENQFAYGAVSRAFQMPAVGLRFLNVPMLDGLAVVTSNQNVEPATLIAYELGYRGKFFDRLQTNLNLYYNTYDDLTVLSPGLGPPGLLHYWEDSSAAASTYGVELETHYALSRQITLLGNYTYEQLDWNADAPFVNKDMMTPPKHKFMLGARYDPLDDLHLSTTLYYVDSVQAPNSIVPFFHRHIPAYFRLDLRAEYEFWKKQASVAVGVRSLLDANHYEGGTLFLNNTEVPRTVYAEFRMTVK